MNEALERARAAYGTGAYDDATIEFLFPELKESEDERIRKELYAFISSVKHNYLCASNKREKWLAYLEKQKEQKPNIELIQRSWYMEGYHDREFDKEPKWVIKTGEGGPKYEKNEKYGQPLEQKPVEWSEELQPEIDAEVEKAYKNADRMQYEKGKEDALKDLPRWKKANGEERFNERLIVLAGNNDLLCTNYAEEGEYYISFSDLEKLPNEDEQ